MCTLHLFIPTSSKIILLTAYCEPDCETQTQVNVLTTVLLTNLRHYLAPPQLKCDFLTAKILILRSVAFEILNYSNENKKRKKK